jgi:hypothetical protein
VSVITKVNKLEGGILILTILIVGHDLFNFNDIPFLAMKLLIFVCSVYGVACSMESREVKQ